jgi:hypothetical protein
LNRQPASFKLAPSTTRDLKTLSERLGKSQARVIDELVNERMRQERPADVDARLRLLEEKLEEVMGRLNGTAPAPPAGPGNEGREQGQP